MTTPNRRVEWRKATYSDQGNGCVELASTLDRVRDSKNPNGPALAVNVPALVAHVKAGLGSPCPTVNGVGHSRSDGPAARIPPPAKPFAWQDTYVPEEVPPELMRASDVDRKAVADRLNAAHDAGMLTLTEFDTRVGAAWQAVTRGELARLTADLPEVTDRPAVRPAEPPAPARPAATVARRGSPTAMRVLYTVWASILAVNVVVWLLVCVTNREVVYPWFAWLLVPGAALGAISWGIRGHRRG